MVELMQKPWFEKHRPRDINDVVFEDTITENRIKSYIDQGYIEGNIISFGPGGVGKTTINLIMANSIVKAQNDLFVLGKSVTDIERLKTWLKSKPVHSKQKIVICEEFDQLSKQAQTALKNGLMENYSPQVAFLVTTNNIHSIDSALLQRFNVKLNFESFNLEGVFFRMIKILEDENITYNRDDVWNLVQAFKLKGIRELINNLQLGCLDNVFSTANLNNTFFSTSGTEETIISYLKYFINYSMTIEADFIYNICLSPNSDPNIATQWNDMISIMEQDPSINYEFIYRTLLDDQEVLLPFKHIIQKYFQQIKLIPMPNIHLQSCMFEVFAAVYTVKGGDKKLIH